MSVIMDEKACKDQKCEAICCKGFFVDIPINSPDNRRYLELHGYETRGSDRSVRIFIASRCSALTDDNLCSLYGKPERPQVCVNSCCRKEAEQELKRINCLKAAVKK